MQKSSIDRPPSAAYLRERALESGFNEAGIVSPFDHTLYTPKAADKAQHSSSPSILVCTLPYGNTENRDRSSEEGRNEDLQGSFGIIAPFARKNHYAEAVARLKKLAVQLRKEFGGNKQDFRIFCNSGIDEKKLAAECGIGAIGRNGLLITASAGSLVIIAAMTLPYNPDPGTNTGLICRDMDFAVCKCCPEPLCIKACPGGALSMDAAMDKTACIQWYASGNGQDIPESIQRVWGKRLYGCTVCQDVCPHNKKEVAGVSCSRGILPGRVDLHRLLAMNDEEITLYVKGSAMGMSWLGPKAIRRSAQCALRYIERREKGSDALLLGRSGPDLC